MSRPAVLQIVRLCVVRGVGEKQTGWLRRRLHWRGQGKLDFRVYFGGSWFLSGGSASTGVGGRERRKEGARESRGRGKSSIIHLNTPETPNSFIYLGENLVCRYLQQEFVSEFKKKA